MKCPKCGKDNVLEMKLIWMSKELKKYNESDPSEYHCLDCDYKWKEKK